MALGPVKGAPILISFLMSHRALAAFLFGAISLLMLVEALSVRVEPGVESMVPTTGGDMRRLREFNETFGSDEIIVLALQGDRLFTAEGLRVVDDLTRRAAGLPHVAGVLSPTNVRDLDGDELGPFPVVPFEKVVAGKMAPEALGRSLAAHPIFGGLIVAAAGPERDTPTAAALLIELAHVQGDDGYRGDLVARVREMAAGVGGGLTARVAGMPVEKVDVAASVERDQRIFAPIILIVLAVAMLVAYRHPVGALVPLGVVALSLLWTLGLYGLTGRTLNPVASLVTPVVLVVSVEGAVHLLNHYLMARSESLGPPAALQSAYLASRASCFNAALTTAIGFASLVVMPIPAIRDFGLFSAAGVMFSYVLTMTLAPLLLISLPEFPARVTGRFRPGPVENALKAIASSVCARPGLVAWASIVVLAISALGVARIHVETDVVRSLRSSSPLYQATHFIDRHLTGVNSLEILLPAPADDDLEGLGKVASLEKEIRSMPGVRKVTGLPDLIARANRAFHAGDDAWERLPEGPEAAQDMSDIRELIRKEAPAEYARFVAPDGRTLRLAARASAMDSSASQDLFRRIREASTRVGLRGIRLTGDFVVFSDMSTSLVYNQISGLAPALVLILTAMAVQFRSARLGLLSLIPNGAPVLMVYGLMGWCGIALSVPTAMIASVAIGMTDDNMIHLMARFREEFLVQRDYLPAMKAALDSSGRAVVFSSVILALGFWVGAFSSFVPSIHFAILTGAVLLLGVLCQAVLLPLSLVIFRPFGPPRRVPAGARVGTALGLALILFATAEPARAAPPPITLKDQFGNADGPALHRGTLVLLLYSDPPALRRMKSWEQALDPRAHEGLKVVRAVDARDVKGKKTEAEASERLRRNVPADISILIDWDGDLARAYALPKADIVVTIIDPSGKPCGTIAGSAAPERVGAAKDLIARVERKGSCP